MAAELVQLSYRQAKRPYVAVPGIQAIPRGRNHARQVFLVCVMVL